MEIEQRAGQWWQSEKLAKAGATLLMLILLTACTVWLSLIGGISDKLVRVISSKEYMAPGTKYLLWQSTGLLHYIYPAFGILIIWVTRRWERWLLLVLALLCIHVMLSGFMYTAGAVALVPKTLN